MAKCWYLVCDKTGKQLWIGQGNEGINLYSGDEKVMENLEAFLRETDGNPVVLVSDDDDRTFMYNEFGAELPTDKEILDWLSIETNRLAQIPDLRVGIAKLMRKARRDAL